MDSEEQLEVSSSGVYTNNQETPTISEENSIIIMSKNLKNRSDALLNDQGGAGGQRVLQKVSGRVFMEKVGFNIKSEFMVKWGNTVLLYTLYERKWLVNIVCVALHFALHSRNFQEFRQ